LTDAMVWDWVMGHGSCGSRVSCLMGHVAHGSQNVTHYQLCALLDTSPSSCTLQPLSGRLSYITHHTGCGSDKHGVWW